MLRSAKKSSNNKPKKVDIYVDSGITRDPFYRFYDSDGDEIVGLKFNARKKYHFHRRGGVASHPFYISYSGPSNAIRIKGDGTVADGITGSEVLKVSVPRGRRKRFRKRGELSYFCTAHPWMLGSFAIKGQNQDTTTADAVITDSTSISSGYYYRVGIDATDQIPLI